MINEKQAIQCLLDLTRRLLGGPQLEHALQAVCDATLSLLPGEHASVRILDESGTRLLCGARTGKGSENQPMTFRLGEGVVGWSVAHRQTVRLDDATEDPRFKQAERQGFNIRSLLTVPLWCGGRVVGVVGVTSPEPGRFSEDEEHLALLVSNCVSPYIDKARLERLSITDPQTMAFNQNYLMPRLREEFERAHRNETRVSLLLMELDGLRRAQKEHSPELAERALSCFADRVRASVRLSDILIRRGPQTFALVMPDMTVGPGSIVADRIRHSVLEYPLEVGAELSIDLEPSFGVACWNNRETAESLLERARAAVRESRGRTDRRTVRARHFAGRQLDANAATHCLRESCNGELEEVDTEGGRSYHRCGSKSCRSIWYFGD